MDRRNRRKCYLYSFVRSLNAQKRKPEGGIISSDAATDPDANPLEVRDTRSEAERRSSEEAEHFLHVAKLSDKEEAAIGSQSAGSSDNSSAGRRAMKKLEQVASDEKFHERPRGPEAAECAYGNIPPAEHDAALLYDAAARIKVVCGCHRAVESLAKMGRTPSIFRPRKGC
jgi:hypothetical protein